MRQPVSKVSLRGSLADELVGQMNESPDHRQVVSEFLRGLLRSGDPDVQQYVDGGTLVVGRRSERGRFPPDW